MVPQLQKPQITEIHVRMDCNGCVHKIKRALSGISGIYDLYIDLPQQKITIVGWADPEKIVKAIKKTRKIATICNIEPVESPPPRPQQAEQPSSSSQQTGQENEENAKSPEQAEAATQTHHTEEEAPTAQPRPSKEPSKDTPPHEQPPNEPTRSPTRQENNACQQPPTSTPRTQDVGEVHMVHHHPRTRDVGEIHHVIQHHHHPPPNYGIGNRYGYGYGYGQSYVGQWDRYHNNSPVFHQQEPSQPIHVTHSYNAYMPSPYVTEYEYVRSPPRFHTHYNNHRMEYYSGDYYYHNGGNSNGNGNGNITSMFSDENPNACRIV